jgi:hypothetical protein
VSSDLPTASAPATQADVFAFTCRPSSSPSDNAASADHAADNAASAAATREEALTREETLSSQGNSSQSGSASQYAESGPRLESALMRSAAKEGPSSLRRFMSNTLPANAMVNPSALSSGRRRRSRPSRECLDASGRSTEPSATGPLGELPAYFAKVAMVANATGLKLDANELAAVQRVVTGMVSHPDGAVETTGSMPVSRPKPTASAYDDGWA